MDQCIDSFLQFLKRDKGASPHTIVAYGQDLRQFAKYLGDEILWDTIETRQLDEYVVWLRQTRDSGRTYTEATVARKVAVVRSFFEYLAAEGFVDPNPAETLQSPGVSRSLPRPLSTIEVDELLEQPTKRTTPEAKRDRAMLELLYATGVRVTELVSLNIADLNMRGPYVRCMGKGSKERTIPLHEQAAVVVADYLDEARAALVKNNRKESALFVNHRGNRLTRQGFWAILKQYAKEAKISSRVTPYTLRHSFATHMLRGGAPLRDVQELLGHNQISTTKLYTQIAEESSRRIYDEAHPRSSSARTA